MQLLDGITFPYDDATRRHLLAVYRQKQSFFDGEIVQEHLLSQPLLCTVLLLFAIISLATFLFSVLFVACRALGNCGAKRYQAHPTSGRQYSLYLPLLVVSWIGLAVATIHFLSSGASYWNQGDGAESQEPGITARIYPLYKVAKREARKSAESVLQLFEDLDYDGDFEHMGGTETTTSMPSFITAATESTTTSTPHITQAPTRKIPRFKIRRLLPHASAGEKDSSFIFQLGPGREKNNIETDSVDKPLQVVKPVKKRKRPIKAIQGPFVWDTWPNAGGKAYYRNGSKKKAFLPTSPVSLGLEEAALGHSNAILEREENEILLDLKDPGKEDDDRPQLELTAKGSLLAVTLPKTTTAEIPSTNIETTTSMQPETIPTTTADGILEGSTQESKKRILSSSSQELQEILDRFYGTTTEQTIIGPQTEDANRTSSESLVPVSVPPGAEHDPTDSTATTVVEEPTTKSDPESQTKDGYGSSLEPLGSVPPDSDHVSTYSTASTNLEESTTFKPEDQTEDAGGTSSESSVSVSVTPEADYDSTYSTANTAMEKSTTEPEPESQTEDGAGTTQEPLTSVPPEYDHVSMYSTATTVQEEFTTKSELESRTEGAEGASSETHVSVSAPSDDDYVSTYSTANAVVEESTSKPEPEDQTGDGDGTTVDPLEWAQVEPDDDQIIAHSTAATVLEESTASTASVLSSTEMSTVSTTEDSYSTSPAVFDEVMTIRGVYVPPTTTSKEPFTRRNELQWTSTTFGEVTPRGDEYTSFRTTRRKPTPTEPYTVTTTFPREWSSTRWEYPRRTSTTARKTTPSTTTATMPTTMTTTRRPTTRRTTISTQPPTTSTTTETVPTYSPSSTVTAPKTAPASVVVPETTTPIPTTVVNVNKSKVGVEKRKHGSATRRQLATQDSSEMDEDISPNIPISRAPGSDLYPFKETFPTEIDREPVMFKLPGPGPFALYNGPPRRNPLVGELDRSSTSGYPPSSSLPVRISLVFIGMAMVVLIVPIPVLVTAGTVCYMRSYHPMDRTSFSERIGQLCVVLATIMLFFTPCLYLYLDAILFYIHVYYTMCPAVQLLGQHKGASLDNISWMHSGSLRATGQKCQSNLDAIEGMWLGCLAFAFFSIPTVFALFKLSKYYLRMKTEYYWNASDAYGVIRPRVATTNDALYGKIYGTLQFNRPATTAPIRPPPVTEPTAYGVFIEQPIYTAFRRD
ncbi:hypothetical protein V3C99_012467 [Haemonchus contortus]|uniref:Transmembrane protein n=1 Tax=Haemonchus contortus TaxID=6289 RepID=A0A7I5E7C3_HAECO|nr:LPXTG-motif cell wall anchor domain protein [Haemonchus contortus]